MTRVALSHFYSWEKIRDDFTVNLLQEFADNGAKHVVLSTGWSKRLVNEPGFIPP